MIRRTLLQMPRKMRFEETWNKWQKGRLTHEETGRILGMSARTFRRNARRVEEEEVKCKISSLGSRSCRTNSCRRPPQDWPPRRGAGPGGEVPETAREMECQTLPPPVLPGRKTEELALGQEHAPEERHGGNGRGKNRKGVTNGRPGNGC
jgi:hypothetical protein